MAIVPSPITSYNNREKMQRERLHNAASQRVIPLQNNPTQQVQQVNQNPGLLQQGAPGTQVVSPQTQQQGPVVQQPAQQPQVPATRENVLQEGQKRVMEGFKSPLQEQYSAETQKLLSDPSMGQDYNQLQNRQLEQYDIQRAKATQAARESAAPVMHSGNVRSSLFDDIISRAQDRSKYETELTGYYGDKERQNLLGALEQARLASGEERQKFSTNVDAINKIIGAGEGEETRKFQGSENEINRDLQERMQSKELDVRTQGIKDQLEFDEWKTKSGYEFTSSESALNRALQFSLVDKDQNFQEKMVGLKEKTQMNLMITQQEWDSVQNDLNRKIQEADITSRFELMKIKQEFENAQAEKQMEHSVYLHEASFDQEKWLNGRAEELKKLGWSHDDAMQVSQQDHQSLLQSQEMALQREIENGRISLEEKKMYNQASQFKDELSYKQWATQSQLDENQADRIWKAKERVEQNAMLQQESSLDRQLQKEIESGRIKVEEQKLLQDASQFKDELSYKQWATQSQLDENQADRIWKSAQSSMKRSHEMNMQNIEIQFKEKGISLQNLMSQLENMDPEQAASVLNQQAVNAGITHIDASGKVVKGLKPVAVEAMEKKQIETESTDILDKVSAGQNISAGDYEILKQSNKASLVPEQYEGDVLYKWTQDARNSKSGYRAWRFKDDVWNWLNQNKGGVFKAGNGEIYRIESFWEPGQGLNDKKKKASVTLKSLKDGKTFQWQGGGLQSGNPGTGSTKIIKIKTPWLP